MTGHKLVINILVIFLTVLFCSCTKNSSLFKEHRASMAIKMGAEIPDSDLTESDEDILTVDYKQFYDELAPHGKWIQVNPKDVGIKDLKGSASIVNENKENLLSEIMGIKSAVASEKSDFVADADFGMFFVWQPDPDLAVSMAVGDETPEYVPYSNGQWIYTDDGWYFQAATPYEDVTMHYGRWVYTPDAGWVWVPGRVWAPAWVDWYDENDYVCWAPIPPRVYVVDDVVPVPAYYYYDDDRYFFCEKRHFCDPDVFRFRRFDDDNGRRLHIKEFNHDKGLIVQNNTIINRGPDVKDISNKWGRDINPVKVTRVNDRSSAGFSGNEIKSYSPHFTYGNHQQKMNSAPKSYTTYNNASSEYKNQRMKMQNSSMSENKTRNNNWNNFGNSKNNNVQRNYSEQKNNINKSSPQRNNQNNNYSYKNRNPRKSPSLTSNGNGNMKNGKTSKSNYNQPGSRPRNQPRNYNPGNNNRTPRSNYQPPSRQPRGNNNVAPRNGNRNQPPPQSRGNNNKGSNSNSGNRKKK